MYSYLVTEIEGRGAVGRKETRLSELEIEQFCQELFKEKAQQRVEAIQRDGGSQEDIMDFTENVNQYGGPWQVNDTEWSVDIEDDLSYFVRVVMTSANLDEN